MKLTKYQKGYDKMVKKAQEKLNDEICPDEICPHCKKPKRIRNPSGFCDHLYYPDCCKICKSREDSKTKQDFAKVLAHNQRRLYEMIIALQQQILCLEVKIKKLERYCYGN
jgi:ribosomal protein L37AE/L43A